MLRAAFLVYLRVLLCLQGALLLFLAAGILPVGGVGEGGGLGPGRWPLLVPALIAALLGLALIATAIRLRQGRRRAAMAAIAIEALWAVGAAALAADALRDAVDAFEYGGRPSEPPWWIFAAAPLFLVTLIGLLLRPFRAYAGLVRRRPQEPHWPAAQ
jgi:hypothetical protein